MAEFKQHCEDCKKYLGNTYKEVHSWLDELALIEGYFDFGHRKYRHHKEGIEEVGKNFDPEARKAAEIHLMRDCGIIPSISDYDQKKVDEFGKNDDSFGEDRTSRLEKFCIEMEYIL